MRSQRRSIEQLRRSIDGLPVDTRVAMLEGVRTHAIVAGAYTDRRGAVCPMLAAHRCGARGDFLGFDGAWDRFTRTLRRARRATEREVAVLVRHLEASLEAEQGVDLAAAIADYRASRERPGDRQPAPELGERPGRAWLRPHRRLDEYERALALVRAEQASADAERPRAPVSA